jgi:hypothetical protein
VKVTLKNIDSKKYRMFVFITFLKILKLFKINYNLILCYYHHHHIIDRFIKNQ